MQVRVVDAGPGFGSDELDRVFDRLTRSDDSRGSGLGLAIARDLVRAHGGDIGASNHPTTGGAVVALVLPASPGIAAPEAALAPRGSARPAAEHARG